MANLQTSGRSLASLTILPLLNLVAHAAQRGVRLQLVVQGHVTECAVVRVGLHLPPSCVVVEKENEILEASLGFGIVRLQRIPTGQTLGKVEAGPREYVSTKSRRHKCAHGWSGVKSVLPYTQAYNSHPGFKLTGSMS